MFVSVDTLIEMLMCVSTRFTTH